MALSFAPLTPAVPAAASDGIFSAASAKSVPDGGPFTVAQVPAKNPKELAGKRIAIVAANGVQEEELVYPYNFLKNRGAEIEIVSSAGAKEKILLVSYLKPTKWVKSTRSFAQAADVKYDLVLVAGGPWSTAVLRKDKDALAFVTKYYNDGGLLAAICTGPQVLIDAGLAAKRVLTGSPFISADLVNAGAVYTDAPVTAGDRLITGKGPSDLAAFMLAAEEALTKK